VRQEPGARPQWTLRRGIGSPVLFAIVYASLASTIYYALGVVTSHALGLTPVVFLIGAVLFCLTAMTYVEGASLHPERGGSTVFARYAFNELVSFVAGWAILLDYVILIAITTYTATQYLSVFWSPLGHHLEALLLALAFIALVVWSNVRGFGLRNVRYVGVLAGADLALQAFVVVLGLVLLFDPTVAFGSVDLGHTPTWSNLVFALTITTVAFTSVESAAGLSGEVRAGTGALRRLVASGTGIVLIGYVGIGLLAISAFPVHGGHSPLAQHYSDIPVIGIVSRMHPHWLAQTLEYLVGAMAALTLVAAANGAMLGLARLAYSLSTNRQIPAGLGRLHPERATPYLLIALAGVASAALVVPEDLEFLIGIYAFGAMLAFTIAHISICRLRYREPDRERPFAVPWSLTVRGGSLPVPAALGALLSGAGLVALVIVHQPARYVGLAWMVCGVAMYVIYRRGNESPLLRRVTVAPQMLSAERAPQIGYGSILVPLLGTDLDDDIVQTAALLVSSEPTDEASMESSTIEALWIFEIPMALPLDARLPEAQVQEARRALARAKEVGEAYSGVQVATAITRARRAGHAIVDEARRRGVEAIVLGAEEPPRIGGGARVGGRGLALESFVGEVTRYVIAKADCRVIVTAPPADEARRHGGAGAAGSDGHGAGSDGHGAHAPAPAGPRMV